MKTLRPIHALSVLALAGLQSARPVPAAQLPNAWQIMDSNAVSGTLHYVTNLAISNQPAATNSGFDFSVNARFVTDFGGTKTMGMGYGLGTRRFFIYWELNGSGDLTAELDGLSTFNVTSNGTGTALYHTHQIIYNPATGKASYLVDGQVFTTNWSSSANALTAGQVFWGAGSSTGQGQMNFHAVSFSVTGLGVLADYSPDDAPGPDPELQGWTLVPSSPPANTSVTLIQPDTALLPVATTQAADQVTNTSARLKGQVNPHGSPTTAWFEWGTNTNYGNVTSPQSAGQGVSATNLTVTQGGLMFGPTYHFRVVASNGFGLVAGTNQSFALPGFIKTDIADLAGFNIGPLAWGDYDNDGRLDFLVTGNGGGSQLISKLLRNTGSGFTNVPIPGLTAVSSGSVAWGDYDNDGRLDFLLTGSTNGLTPISQLWRNTGGGFSNVPVLGLPGVYNGSVAWADFDNDGRLDFLITGSGISQLWRNTGSNFVNVTTNVVPGLAGVSSGSVAWGDYDNDGWLDFLLTGFPSNGIVSQLWRNTGGGFSNVPIPGLPGLYNSSVAWGDYDQDGLLDFLLTGTTNGITGILQLWRNTGSGFTNVAIPGLPGVTDSSAAWGDYDNDGRLDFLITGTTNGGAGQVISQLWRNTGSGFSNVTTNVAPGLPGVWFGSAAWGDSDNDGKLDFLITGYNGVGGFHLVSQLWQNNLAGSNAPPAAPAGLSAAVSGNTVTLSWNASADDHTPAAGLSYNVRIGTAPGGSDILAPQALANGTRLLPQIGNAGSGLSAFSLLPLPGRDYYWSVQAVDTGFAGSPFAADGLFSVAPFLPRPVFVANGVFRFDFTNNASGTWRVRATTNLLLPAANWDNLGNPISLGGGNYQFYDFLVPYFPQRYFILQKQ